MQLRANLARRRAGGGGGPTPPTPTGLIVMGDSRFNFTGGLTGSGTSVLEAQGTARGYGGRLFSALGNVIQPAIGYCYGVTSSTTLAMELRATSSSIAQTGNSAGSAYPAGTGAAADVKYNQAALGDYSPVDHPANVVAILGAINSFGVAWYTDGTGSGGGGNNTLGVMKSMARLVDTLLAAGKVVFVGETPKGKSTVWLETKAVASATFTATNTTGFVGADDWSVPCAEVVTAAGAVLTKVASAPGPGQYSRTSGGVYTVDSGLNGTNVYITYSHGSANQTTTAMKDFVEWLNSEAASFTAASGTAYGIPGLRNSRPFCYYWPIWEALIDSGTGDAKAGTMQDGIHPSHAGSTLGAAAFATAFQTVYPSFNTPLTQVTAIGSFECGNAGGSSHYQSSSGLGGALQLPTEAFNTSSPPAASAVRFVYNATAGAGPTIITATDIGGGLYRLDGANVDHSHDADPGNFINTATGHWDLWLSVASGSRIYFENGDFNNFVPNSKMRASYGSGTKSGTWTGTPPKNWTMGCSDAALGTTLTVSAAEGTDPETGEQAWVIDINGLAGASGNSFTITSNNNQILNRLRPSNNDKAYSEARIRVEPGTNGRLYGLYTRHNRLSFTASGSATRGAYTGVTAIGNDGELGLINYPMTDMDLEGGAYVAKIMSPPVDVSAPMTLSAAVFSFTLTWQASKPVSARVYVSRVAGRIAA